MSRGLLTTTMTVFKFPGYSVTRIQDCLDRFVCIYLLPLCSYESPMKGFPLMGLSNSYAPPPPPPPPPPPFLSLLTSRLRYILQRMYQDISVEGQ